MNNDKESLLAAAESVSRAILSTVPFSQIVLGYYDALKAKQAKRKFDRLIELCNKLGEDLQTQKEVINNEYVKQEDFLDIVEEVTTKVINERSEEKRQYYKNIFLHSVTAEEVDYDITEKYLNLLSRLENEDIVVFAALHHPDIMNEEKGCPLKNPNEQVDGYFNYSTITKHKSVSWALTKLLGWNDEQVMDSLNVLQRERLIEEGTDKCEQEISGSQIMLLKNHLTIKGRSFAEYLMM
mgnify:CR=1 FL=1